MPPGTALTPMLSSMLTNPAGLGKPTKRVFVFSFVERTQNPIKGRARVDRHLTSP